jgi:hypothetical protein
MTGPSPESKFREADRRRRRKRKRAEREARREARRATPGDRRCDWGSPHPPDVEARARELALADTCVRYDVPPGCYLREACAEMRERCPAIG